MITSVRLDVIQWKLEQINNLGRLGEGLEPGIEIVAVVKVCADSAIGQLGHYAFGKCHGAATVVRLRQQGAEAWAFLAGVEFGGVKPAGIKGADGHIRLSGDLDDL